MKLSKRQLKRIIREEKQKLQEMASTPRQQHPVLQDVYTPSLDHLINCFESGMTDEECADSMPNDIDVEELQDFANFVMRAVNTYRDQGNF